MLNLLARKPEFLALFDVWALHTCYALRAFHVDAPAPCAHCEREADRWESFDSGEQEWQEDQRSSWINDTIREIEFMIAEK